MSIYAVDSFWCVLPGKIWKNMENRPFFRADMAGLGKYCTGGYGRIGVYRVKMSVTPAELVTLLL